MSSEAKVDATSSTTLTATASSELKVRCLATGCSEIFSSRNQLMKHVKQQHVAEVKSGDVTAAEAPVASNAEVKKINRHLLVLLASDTQSARSILASDPLAAMDVSKVAFAIERWVIRQLVRYLDLPCRLKNLTDGMRATYIRYLIPVLQRIKSVLQYGLLSSTDLTTQLATQKPKKRGYVPRHASCILSFMQLRGSEILYSLLKIDYTGISLVPELHTLHADILKVLNREQSKKTTDLPFEGSVPSENTRFDVHTVEAERIHQHALKQMRLAEQERLGTALFRARQAWIEAGSPWQQSASHRRAMDACLSQLFLLGYSLPLCICCYGEFGSGAGKVGPAKAAHLLSYWYRDKVQAYDNATEEYMLDAFGRGQWRSRTQAANFTYDVQCADCENQQSKWELPPGRNALWVADLRKLRDNGHLGKRTESAGVPHNELFRFLVVNFFRMLMRHVRESTQGPLHYPCWHLYDSCRALMHCIWKGTSTADQSFQPVMYCIPFAGNLYLRVTAALRQQHLQPSENGHAQCSRISRSGSSPAAWVEYLNPLYFIIAERELGAAFEPFRVRASNEEFSFLMNASPEPALLAYIVRLQLFALKRDIEPCFLLHPRYSGIAAENQQLVELTREKVLDCRGSAADQLDWAIIAGAFLRYRSLYPVWWQTGKGSLLSLQPAWLELELEGLTLILVQQLRTAGKSNLKQRMKRLSTWKYRLVEVWMPLLGTAPEVLRWQLLQFFLFLSFLRTSPAGAQCGLADDEIFEWDSTSTPIEVTPLPQVALKDRQRLGKIHRDLNTDRVTYRVQRIAPLTTKSQKQENTGFLNLVKECCLTCATNLKDRESMICKRCNKVAYCSKDCQLKDWNAPLVPHAARCTSLECNPVMFSAGRDGALILVHI